MGGMVITVLAVFHPQSVALYDEALAGLPADRIIATMADYKRGTLPATIMHQIAKGYTDEQIRLVAGYFAAQPAGR